jgi:hypothetical protein
MRFKFHCPRGQCLSDDPRRAGRIRPAVSHSTHGSYVSPGIGGGALAVTVRRTPSRQQRSPSGLPISVSLTNIFTKTRVGAVRDKCDHGRLNPENGRWFSEKRVFILNTYSTHGHAIYDLVRLAISLGLSTRRLSEQVRLHGVALGCTPAQSTHQLLAALGHPGLHLGDGPEERFVAVVEQCTVRLAVSLR